ncbi:hypothetical protein [Streptomyces candidus]|uniref:Lipoprotein CseA n=1 Tax=Streptomyces candidus TaxID=67283 RepID=A0A7X0HLR0_9ACTN|nr:hypothetical protein [Streptomyces candidus]GHH57318.1 lipoprotein CseA [Streptomyces candidus]
MAASGTAAAGLAAVGLFAVTVVSCGAGGTGTRDEGPAAVAVKVSPRPQTAASSSAAAPAPADRVDPVELLKNDPKVSAAVKADLKPCVKNIYPVDASYGKVTGNTADDIVVNVLTCGDAIGIGSYVFREDNGHYKNVFVAEEPAVYAEIDRGDLVVTRPEYRKGDPVAFPSGEVVVTYRWAGHRFSEHDRVENSYSKAVGNGDGTGEEPSSAPRVQEEDDREDARRKAEGSPGGTPADSSNGSTAVAPGNAPTAGPATRD